MQKNGKQEQKISQKEQKISQKSSKNELYVVQPHAVARAYYKLSLTGHKLLKTAILKLKTATDEKERAVTISMKEIYQITGMLPCSENTKLVKNAMKELAILHMTIESGEDFRLINTIECADYVDGLLTIKFTETFLQVYNTLENLYQKIQIEELMQFKHSNALRLFEIAKSWESEEGKKGNRPGEWFFYEKVPEIKKKLGIEESKWQETNNFHRKIIKNGVDEINSLNLSLKIDYKPEKSEANARYIERIKFTCHKPAKKTAKQKTKSAKNEEESPEKAKLRELDAQEEQKWREKYPKEWDETFRRFANDEKPPHIPESAWLTISCVTRTIASLKAKGLTIDTDH